MKKLYLLLVTAILSLTCYATDYYYCGGLNGWATSDANYKFTAQSDGTYTLDLPLLKSDFKINNGSWADGNYVFGAPHNSDANLVIGQAFNLEASTGSKNITLNANIADAHLVFNPTAKTLLVTGEEVQAVYTYALSGQLKDGKSWVDIDMENIDGNWVYSGDVVPGEFGIKKLDGKSQAGWYSADGTASIGTAQLDQPLKVKLEGSNWKSTLSGSYKFSFDPEAMTLTVSANGDNPDPGPDPDPTYKDLYIAGAQFGWDAPAPAAKMTREGNVYTITVEEGLSGEWKIWDGTWDYYFGPTDSNVALDTESDMWFKGFNNAKLITNSKTTVTFTLVEGSDVADSSIPSKLTVTAEGGDQPIEYTYALSGNIVDGETWTDLAMENKDGKWVYTGDIVAGDFGVKKLNGTTQADWYSAPKGSAAVGEAQLDKALALANSDNENFTSTLAGNYTFTLDAEAMTLTITKNGGDDPDPDPTYKDLYIAGAQFGWDAPAPAAKMTREGNVYTITVEEGLSGEWKIWDGTWDYYFGPTDSNVALDTESDMWFKGFNNAKLITNSKTTVTFTLVEGSDVADSSIPSKLTVTAEGGDQPIEYTYALSGNIVDGETWTDLAMENKDGKWVYTGDIVAGDFGVKKLNGATQADWYSAPKGSAAVGEAQLDQAITLANSDNENFTSTLAGNYTFTLDAEAMTLTITKNGGDDPDPDPVVVYLMGECNEWAASDTYKFTQNGNVYTLSLPSLTGKFKIASADWKTINYGADGMNGKDVLQNNVEAPAYWDSSVDFSVADELTDVVITFTYNEDHTQASTIKVSGTVGLQSVDYADGVVRVNGGVISVDGCDDYSVYTTSGVLVSRNAEASVTPGFYLVVINGKAVKVAVK